MTQQQQQQQKMTSMPSTEEEGGDDDNDDDLMDLSLLDQLDMGKEGENYDAKFASMTFLPADDTWMMDDE